MSERAKRVAPALGAVLLWAAAMLPAAAQETIFARTAGIALETPDFYSVAFTSGDPAAWISSVTLVLPMGFFDFDGDTSFMNVTAPVLHLPSLQGLLSSDISFRFSGVHPTSLTVAFAPEAFRVGDSLRFAADVDDWGSKLGGVFGAGATFSATLGSGLSSSASFRTDTSVSSTATVTVLPEPSPLLLLSSVLAALALSGCRKRRVARRPASGPASPLVHEIDVHR
jgi:hypothetical protein